MTHCTVFYLMIITVLHPGAMGAAVAGSLQRAKHDVFFVPAGRSMHTLDRADNLKLQKSESLHRSCEESDVIISVCPPHGAEDMAREVAHFDFKGVYVDANAVSPERTRSIQEIVEGGGATFVDGGIVGGPPKDRHQTYLYLSGPQAAHTVASCFSEGLIEAEVISDRIGDAAETMGVRDRLFKQWKEEGSGLDEAAEKRTRFVTKKAWRWIDEMEEISKTFESAGQPGGFHSAAADVYRRIEHLKHNGEPPEFMEVLTSIMRIESDSD